MLRTIFRRTPGLAGAGLAAGFAALVLASGAFSLLLSQTVEEGGQDVAAADTSLNGVIRMREYNPLAVSTPYFHVKGLTFERRYAGNGWGEFLDVVFTLENQTTENRDVFMFVTAYYEDDAVNEELRALIPYPAWRDRDYPADERLVRYLRTTPETIPETKIWNEQDPYYQQQKILIERMRNSVAGVAPVADPLPPFWKYAEYMSRNPTEGLRFTVYGNKGPDQGEAVKTNYQAPSPEERKNRVHETLIEHTYTVQMQRRMTIVRSHHFSRFRPQYYFFNRVGILIFDAKDAETFMEQQGQELEPGEERVQPLMYKRIFAFEDPIRIR